MSKQAFLHPRYDTDALNQFYRTSQNIKESRRWQLLWLISCGKSVVEAARCVDFSNSYAYNLLHRYNKHGIRVIRANPSTSKHPRRPFLLSVVQRRLLGKALKRPPKGGGLWSGPKVAKWMEQKLGRPVHVQRGWEYLRRFGYSLQQPRPHHQEASRAKQARFKKNSETTSKSERRKWRKENP